jgi:hypothetical protein
MKTITKYQAENGIEYSTWEEAAKADLCKSLEILGDFLFVSVVGDEDENLLFLDVAEVNSPTVKNISIETLQEWVESVCTQLTGALTQAESLKLEIGKKHKA